MANNFYGAIALTGGTTGAVDEIDGTNLVDGDGCFASTSSGVYIYLLDVDSGLAEASPGIIAPDTNPGNKRWILQNVQMNQSLDPLLDSDHTWCGTVATFTVGENVVIGDVCYRKSDGKYWLADADAVATSRGHLAMATGTILANASGVFLLRGFIRDDSWAWDIATEFELYISVTPGNPTSTLASGSGDIIRIVGYVHTADIVYFNPSPDYFEIP